MIISSLIARPEICVGVAQLLFEVSRGVAQQFHSCTSSFLPLLLTRLGQCADSSSDSASDPSLSCDQLTFRALSKMVELMAEHTRKEFSEPLWTSLLVSVVTGIFNNHIDSTVRAQRKLYDVMLHFLCSKNYLQLIYPKEVHLNETVANIYT